MDRLATESSSIVPTHSLCLHFKMSRADLFQIVKVKRLRDHRSIMRTVSTGADSIGCEVCKPAIASILASLYNEHVMKPRHHGLQDTNDRFLANIQRNGTFSVVPRIPGGEVTPDGLIVIGQVAKKYGLYTKITGGQRVDLFGVQKADLPAVWEELIAGGFESGHAYGKSLRTVKVGIFVSTDFRTSPADPGSLPVLCRLDLVSVRRRRLGRDGDRSREPVPRSPLAAQVQGRRVGLRAGMRRSAVERFWTHRHRCAAGTAAGAQRMIDSAFSPQTRAGTCLSVGMAARTPGMLFSLRRTSPHRRWSGSSTAT